RRVHSQRKTRTHRTHRTASMGRVHAPSSHPDRSEKRQSHHLPATQRKGNTMSTSKTPVIDWKWHNQQRRETIKMHPLQLLDHQFTRKHPEHTENPNSPNEYVKAHSYLPQPTKTGTNKNAPTTPASPPIHTRTHRTHRKPRRHKRIRKSALLPHTTGTRQKRQPRNRHNLRRWPSACFVGGRGPTNRNRE